MRVIKYAVPRTNKLNLEHLLKALMHPKQGPNRSSDNAGVVPNDLIRLSILLSEYRLQDLVLIDLFPPKMQKLLGVTSSDEAERLLASAYPVFFAFVELMDWSYTENSDDLIRTMNKDQLVTTLETFRKERSKKLIQTAEESGLY